jgi:hypothetical protein
VTHYYLTGGALLTTAHALRLRRHKDTTKCLVAARSKSFDREAETGCRRGELKNASPTPLAAAGETFVTAMRAMHGSITFPINFQFRIIDVDGAVAPMAEPAS